jgi:hypothetical protein
MNRAEARTDRTGPSLGSYRLFGLQVASEIPLLQPECPHGPPDVVIRRARLGYDRPEASEDGPLVSAGAGSACYFWPEIGWVEVRRGEEVLVEPAPEASTELLSHILQGVAMATVLDQRGTFTLHASAVAIDGRAVAFLGWKGHGKSTLCATLYGRGHGFITDDVLALEERSGGLHVLPGTAQIKLYPDALEAALGEAAEPLPQIWSLSPKRFRAVADGVHEPLPLAAIYVLASGGPGLDRVAIEPVAPHAGCIELIRHSYALRFLGQEGATAEHLVRCAALARRIPMRRLVRPAAAVARVHESADALELDVMGAAAAGSSAAASLNDS